MMIGRTYGTRVPRKIIFTLMIVMLALPWFTGITLGQNATGFSDVDASQRVYDETGTSLTPEQIDQIERRLEEQEKTIDADVIVYVRALDADPEETLDQVEALQQTWVEETGANQDNAVAILINRNPDDPNDARAGIYVGRTFDDGNVPRQEQRRIVDDALIPPLRNGDVYGSLSDALDRLENDIRYGPPQNAFERWSSDVAGTWLPWTGLALAVIGFMGALYVFNKRETIDQVETSPTTSRPGDLSPALAGALAAGSPQASAVPATVLDLATRGALDLVPESEGGMFSQPKIAVRLVDNNRVHDEVGSEVWQELSERAEGSEVSSKNLQKLAQGSKAVRKRIEDRMRAEGWLSPDAGRWRAALSVICFLAAAAAIFGIVVVSTSEQWLPLVGIVPLAALAATALWMAVSISNLSRRGQEAAMPWKVYRKGLDEAAKNEAVELDLDETLPDIVAMNLGSAMKDRLERAAESGLVLRAFADATSGQGTAASYIPIWVAFNSTFASSSSSSTVSGGGAGGGGGAAGST